MRLTQGAFHGLIDSRSRSGGGRSCLSTAAVATASSTAGLTNLRIDLIDLDPGDEIAPSLTLRFSPEHNLYRGSWVRANVDSPILSTEASTLTAYGPIARSASSTASFSSAAVTGAGTMATFALDAAGQTTADSSEIVDGRNTTYAGAAGTVGNVEVTPRTRVRITADAQLSGLHTENGIRPDEATGTPGFTEAAVAHAWLYLRVRIGATEDFGYDVVWAGVSSANPLAEPGIVYTSARTLDITVDNPSGGYASGTFDVGIEAYGATIMGIPEPSTWAMSLAGLGALGLAPMRRRLCR